MVAQDISNRTLGEPFDGPVMIWMRFAVPKPKTTKLSHPKPDIDNYEKALFDALTKAGNVWNDDHQIVKILESSKVWTEQPNGGIVVSVMPLGEFDVPYD
jgi:Holliday junction resolvase RusA-like endonuclease